MSDTTDKYTYDSFVFDLEQTDLKPFSEGYSYKEGIKEVNTANFLSNNDTSDADGYFPLTYACGNGVPPEYIAKLINCKNVEDKTKYTEKGIGKTPLQVACTSMAIDTVKLLLGYEVDCNPLVCRADVILRLTSEFPIDELKAGTLPKTSSEYKLYRWILDDSNIIPQTTFELDPNDGTIEEQERKKQRKEAKHQADREKKAIDLLANAIKEPFMLRKMVTSADASAYINKINFALQNYFKSEYYTIPVDKLQPLDEASNGSRYDSVLEKASIENTEYFKTIKVTYLDLCSACSLPKGGDLVKLLVDYWDNKLGTAIAGVTSTTSLDTLLKTEVKQYLEFLNGADDSNYDFTPLHYTAISQCYDSIKYLSATESVDTTLQSSAPDISTINEKSPYQFVKEKDNPGLLAEIKKINGITSYSGLNTILNNTSSNLTNRFSGLITSKCYEIIRRIYAEDKLFQSSDSDKQTFSCIDHTSDFKSRYDVIRSTILPVYKNQSNGGYTNLLEYECYNIITALLYHNKLNDAIINSINHGKLITTIVAEFDGTEYINLADNLLSKLVDASSLNTTILTSLLGKSKIKSSQVSYFSNSNSIEAIAEAIKKEALKYDNIKVLVQYGTLDLVQALYSILDDLHNNIINTLVTPYPTALDMSRLGILILLNPSPLKLLADDQLKNIDHTQNPEYIAFIAGSDFNTLFKAECFNAIFYKLINAELTEDDITKLNEDDSDTLASIANAFSSLSDDNTKLDIIRAIIQNDCDVLFTKLVSATSGPLCNHIWAVVNDTTVPDKIASAITTKELITEINCVNQSLYNILRLYAKAKDGKLEKATLDKLNRNKDKSAIESVFRSTYIHCTNETKYSDSLLKILIDNKFTFIIDVLNQLVKFNSYEISKIQKAIQAGDLDGSLLPSIIDPSIPEEPEPEPPVNTPPVIVLDSYFTCDSTASIEIDASNSYDNENDTLSFNWSGNGANYLSSKTSSCPIFTPPSNLSSSAAYSLIVTVTDTHGLSSSKSATVQCVASKNIGTFAFASGTFAVETDPETKMCTTNKTIETVKSEWERAYNAGHTNPQIPNEPYSLIYSVNATIKK